MKAAELSAPPVPTTPEGGGTTSLASPPTTPIDTWLMRILMIVGGAAAGWVIGMLLGLFSGLIPIC